MLFSQTIASWNRSCCTDTVVATPWGKKNWRIVQEFCKALKKSSDDLKKGKKELIILEFQIKDNAFQKKSTIILF